jgi:hypothetical protein
VITTTYTNCQWIGAGEGCEHDTEPGRAYCEHHLWRVYEPGSATARRHKDIRTAAAVHTWESLFNEAVEELISEGMDL